MDTSRWNKVVFGDIARCLTVATKAPLAEGLDRYVGLEHIEPGNIHIKAWGNVTDGTTFTRVFRKGQVLFGKRRAYQKKAALAEFDGLCSGDILVCEAIDGAMIPELLPFIVQSDSFFNYAIKTSAGSLSPRTKFKDLAKFSLKLPVKRDEQKRIADLLWSIDAVMEKKLNLLAALEIVRLSYEKKCFGGANDVTSLSQVVKKFISGGTPSTKNKKYWEDGDVPWITTKKIENFSVCEGERYITELAVDESNTNVVPKGNILFGTRVGIGKCARAEVDLAINQDVTGIVVDEDKINAEYLFFQLISECVQSQINCFARGTTVKGITKQDLKIIKIAAGSKDQNSIGLKFRLMWHTKNEIKNSAEELKKIQQRIINQMFG